MHGLRRHDVSTVVVVLRLNVLGWVLVALMVAGLQSVFLLDCRIEVLRPG